MSARRLFRAAAYVVAVVVHAVLVVCGYSYLMGARYVQSKVLYLLAAACLLPVFCGWVAVTVYLVLKRVRTGTRLPMLAWRLVDIAVLTALAATVCYRGYRGALYRITDPFVRTRWFQATCQLESAVEGDLRRFYYKHARLPKDLEELAVDCWEDEQAAIHFYTDPCTLLHGGSRALFRYVPLDSTTVLVYGVGPDGDDDKGEKEFTEELFRYHPSFPPWQSMPFGRRLYKASGLASEFDGDITRRISFKDQEPMHDETP